MRKVDCIIPVYQPDPGELAFAVKSALAQTCQCTITLVDDGSDAQGKRILKDVVAETGVNIITLGENHGPGAARNIGASVGLADYVWFCDADDWAEPSFLATALGAFENHPTAVIARSGVNFIGKLPSIARDDPRLALAIKTIPGNAVIKRWAFLQAGGFATGPEFRTNLGGEDAALFRCLSMFGPSLGINNPLYNLRVSEGDHFWRFIEETKLSEEGKPMLATTTESRIRASEALLSRTKEIRQRWQVISSQIADRQKGR